MKYILLSICFLPLLLSAQNFEGVIVYDQRSPKGHYALITYYLKGYNLRIESQFFNKGKVDRYTSIYRFNEYPNQQFELVGNRFVSKTLKQDAPLAIIEESSDIETLLEFKLKKYVKSYERDFMGEVNLRTDLHCYFSDDLTFELPENCDSAPYMISSNTGKILLAMKVKGSNDMTDGYSYFRKAISIQQTNLPDSLFIIN